MSSKLSRHILLLSIVVLIALLVIGCAPAEEDITPPDGMDDTSPIPPDEDEEDEDLPSEVEIYVTAGNGFFDPNTITVEQGQIVHVTIESVGDIVHTFTIDEFNVHVILNPGDLQEVTFTATEAGAFEFYCSETGHYDAGMHGSLTVE